MSSRKQCKVEGCIRPAIKKGYCDPHYRKLGNPRKCSIEGCDEPHAAKGYCQVHYKKMKREGILVLENDKGCIVDGCDRPHLAKGYCKAHYERAHHTGSPEKPEREVKICVISGCEEVVHAREMCNLHYRRFLRFGDPEKVKRICKYEKDFTSTQAYRVWRGMKSRCYNKNSRGYRWYGSRGITVCDEWINSFEQFYKDMGDPPTEKHQIDRIDNNGNYSKENCRWVLSAHNNRNRRSTKLTEEIVEEIRLSNLSVSLLSRKHGISISYIHQIKNHLKWKPINNLEETE